jgi:protein-disulfide isomerase
MRSFLVAALVAVSLQLGACTPSKPDTGAPPPANAEEAAFDAQVRAALLRNPQWLDEVEQLRTREMVETDPRSFVLGRKDAPVTLVLFADYRCPFCHKSEEWVFAVAAKNPDVKIVFKEFPVLGPGSVEAAVAAIAAGNQGRYVEMHRALMASTGDLTSQAIDAAAQKAGVNVSRMRADMQDQAIGSYLQAVSVTAKRLGIDGTPAMIVNGELIEGGWNQKGVEDAIARVIAEAKPT